MRTKSYAEPQVNQNQPYVENHVNLSSRANIELEQQLKSQQAKIHHLEKKLNELFLKMQDQPTVMEEDFSNLLEMRKMLKPLELSDSIISTIIKKARFELTDSQLEDAETVYDFCLREIHSLIRTEMPLFSSSEVQGKGVLTVLLSEASVGQSTMAQKLSVLQENCTILRFRNGAEKKAYQSFATQVFNIEIVEVNAIGALMSELRKRLAEGQRVVLDFKAQPNNDDTKKIIASIKKSFENVEFLAVLSAINSENYNRKILSKYKDFLNGVTISYMDQCLNFGSIVNVHNSFNTIPLKFYGTGMTVPEDIESATGERILAGMFEL